MCFATVPRSLQFVPSIYVALEFSRHAVLERSCELCDGIAEFSSSVNAVGIFLAGHARRRDFMSRRWVALSAVDDRLVHLAQVEELVVNLARTKSLDTREHSNPPITFGKFRSVFITL